MPNQMLPGNSKPAMGILLYGNSILIESLFSKLKQMEKWDLKRVESGEIRDVFGIDYIVADLCDSATSQALPMLNALPGIILIGLDPIANTLIVLTGRTRPLGNLQAVLNVLKAAM